ncbi:MAG TPA: energy transducer TonB [Terracidiphilus sp.]|jgi:outer membrane biosynthesis protein TonB
MRFAGILSVAILAVVTPFAGLVQQNGTSRPADSNPPGPSTSGVEILSDTQGVDFKAYLKEWRRVTEETWNKQMPAEVNPPTLSKGVVQIRFKILPNGQPKDLMFDGRSGHAALDRAAWYALANPKYTRLPDEFHGPYLELRAVFMYNQKGNER